MKPMKVEELKNEELKTVDGTETAETSVELTDNTTKEPETAPEPEPMPEKEEPKEPEHTKSMVVTYIGSGIWKDSENSLWAREDKGNAIRKTRIYPVGLYEKRDDIKFMVGYGAMICVEA